MALMRKLNALQPYQSSLLDFSSFSIEKYDLTHALPYILCKSINLRRCECSSIIRIQSLYKGLCNLKPLSSIVPHSVMEREKFSDDSYLW